MQLSRRRFVQFLGAGAATSLVAPTAAARGLEARLERAPWEYAPAGLVRLDSNENPRGPGRAARVALEDGLPEANRYPDAAADLLRADIARVHGLDVAQVVLGCGSTDIIRACVQAFAGPGRGVVTAVPSYESPGREAERIGAPVTGIPVRPDLALDLDAMAAAAKGAGLVYLCNPNNPTATVHGRTAVRDFIARVHRDSPETVILVDEAYHEFVDDPAYESMLPLAATDPKVVVARTFSKVHGLAGLRVGYGIGTKATAAQFERQTLDIGVNVLGAVSARASLASREHIVREQALNREAREYTMKFFQGMGYAPAPSQANFVMVDIRRDAKAFRAACRDRGIAVGRLFPPLLTHARVSIGTMEEMRKATDVFRQVLSMA